MKYLWVFILILTGFACNDKSEPTGTSSARPKILNDTNKPVAPARNPYAEVDVSPMDMSYLPADYPKMTSKDPLPVARLIYSRPHKQGRVIFGNLVQYGEPWRLGANEATEVEFFKPVTIQGKNVDKGRYILYSIPHENEWTVYFNKNLNSWGLNLDSARNVYHFKIPAQKKNQSLEFFTMVFQKNENGSDLVIAWDSIEARLPIQHGE